MAEYHFYYIGWMDREEHIYPLGPYDCNGVLRPVIAKSRSFMSDLYEDFWYVQDKMVTDELRQKFAYKDYNGEEVMPDLRYIKISNLGSGDFVKRGYYLTDDVQMYLLHDAPTDEIFFERLAPEVYAAKYQTEISLGKKQTNEDDAGEDEYTVQRSVTDFMYFAYPDYHSKEYETHQLLLAADMFEDFLWEKRNEGITLVAIFE